MITKTAFKGMDNRHRAESLPEGYVRNAVNVLFNAMGKAQRVNGATKLYAGTDCHSWHEIKDGTAKGYFIDNGELKRLENDDTAFTLGTVVNDYMGYTDVGGFVICGNGVDGYVIDGDSLRTLGLDWPEQQPVLTARDLGGMFAGDYQVAITYMRDGEESGCGNASKITLTDGQGIYFQVPTVPADIDTIAVYCSSVNGNELYLYGEYPASTTEVFIDSHLSDLRIESQFKYRAIPSKLLIAHYGRLYWAEGNRLHFSTALKYGYTESDHYHQFEGDITLIASVPGALYVCADKTYRLSNIDGEGFTQRVEVLPYGAIDGTVCYDERTKAALWQSHQGIVAASAEGIQEMIADVIAYPRYQQGSTTIIERDGVRYLMALGKSGTPSNLMDAQFKSEEITRKGNAL